MAACEVYILAAGKLDIEVTREVSVMVTREVDVMGTEEVDILGTGAMDIMVTWEVNILWSSGMQEPVSVIPLELVFVTPGAEELDIWPTGMEE